MKKQEIRRLLILGDWNEIRGGEAYGKAEDASDEICQKVWDHWQANFNASPDEMSMLSLGIHVYDSIHEGGSGEIKDEDLMLFLLLNLQALDATFARA